MNQERKFLDVLGKTRSYKIEMGKLMLLDESDKEIACRRRPLGAG